jgi:hypothetical protein
MDSFLRYALAPLVFFAALVLWGAAQFVRFYPERLY